MSNKALPIDLMFAQVDLVHTHNGGSHHELANHDRPAPPSLKLAGLGVTGGTNAETVAANTSFNRPIPAKETALTPA